MSNEMILVGVKFHIDPGREEAAEVALRAAARFVLEKKDMRAGDIQEVVEGTGLEVEQLTLDQLVECWGWSLIRDLANRTDEIIAIEFREDFSSDEERLFEALGPFVTAGCYIDLEGKRSGFYWRTRYGFTGERVVELEPVIPPVPLSQFSRGKIQATVAAIWGNPEPESDPIDLYQMATGFVLLAQIQGDYYLCFLVEDEGGELKCPVHIPLPLGEAVTRVVARELTSLLAERWGATKIPHLF